jgi:beta-lactamase regulating signal transducer with metallopeptidase domain
MLTQIANALAHQAPWLFAIVWKTTALLLATWATTHALRNHSASLRHFLHSVTVCAVLILPAASILLPSLRLAVLPASWHSEPRNSVTSQQSQAHPSAGSESAPKVTVAPAKAVAAKKGIPSRSSVAPAAIAARSDQALIPSSAQTIRAGSQFNWQGMAVLIWICGAAVCLMRMLSLKWRLHLLVRRAVQVESIPLTSRLRWLCRDYGIRREVVVVASPELDVPIATGVLNPKIVLSPQSSEWTEARRNAVLCHELAHIRRFDAFTQFLAGVAAALYWFNPLMWLNVRAMRVERERACDDYVLAFGTAASDYAHELLDIVSTLRRPQPAAALAMARRSKLEGRVLALLNPHVHHGMISRASGTLLACLVFAVALPLSAATLQERPTEYSPNAPAAGIVAPALAGVDRAPVAEPPAMSPPDPALAPAAAPNPTPAPMAPPDPSAAPVSTSNFEYHNNSTQGPAPFDCFEGSSANHTNISSHSDGEGYKTWMASWSGGACTLEARSSGAVHFNAEATAIESITPGGYFEIDERKGDTLRYVRAEPASSGQLNYTYKVNSAAREFDAEARAWFSRFLLEMERATGFSASTRVPDLLSKGGPQAVLTEITQLRADYVRQTYFTKLFENATLPGPMLVKALDQARDEISTDYSLAQVLLAIAQRYDLNDEAQRVAFLNATRNLHTDYEHSRVLIELLKRPNLSPQILRAALESAKSIGTDYEKGRILTTLAGLSTFDESEINTYLDLASSIGTDYEHSRSLMVLMERQKLSPQAVSQILKSASSIGTDYEKSRILIAVSGSNQFDEKQIAAYLTLVDSIGTDYERSRDLMALMARHKLKDESVARIITEAQKIGTDSEKARVLTAAAQRYQLQGAVRDAYIKAANSIGTEYERNRTLAAVAKRAML